MTDDQAFAVLVALADVPYPWMRPGVRFRWHLRAPGMQGPVLYDVHAGVVVRRDDRPDGGVAVRMDACPRDYFPFSTLRDFADNDGDVFEPEDQP